MKVLFLFYKYPLYPAGSYFQEFLNSFANSIEQIYLIAGHYPKGSFKKPANLKIFWIPLLNIRFVGDAFFMLAALLRVVFTRKLHKVDLVNTIGPRGLLVGWYLKKAYGIPLICTIEMLNEKGSVVNDIYYEVVRFLIKKVPVDKFICWSNYYWENHLKKWGISEKKVVIIRAGIDTEKYNPNIDGSEIKRRYAPNDPLIVFAKPLYSVNTESAKLLLRAIAILKPKIKIKLLIGGGEGQKEVQKLAEDLNVMDQVDFMPPTSFPEIPKYIAAADLIVLPFTYAPTTSRSLLEAMAIGKPIITTNVGEIPNIVKNGKEVLLVNPIKEEIAGAIELVLGDRVLATSLGHNAAALVNKNYSLSKIIPNYAYTVKVFSPIKKVEKN